MPRKSTPKKQAEKKRFRAFRWLFKYLVLPASIVLVFYTLYLDVQVREKFEGKRWALPARVYAQPLELFAGKALKPEHLSIELKFLRYQPVASPSATPGTYARAGNDWYVTTRGETNDLGQSDSKRLKIRFAGNQIADMQGLASGQPVDLARLEPAVIGSFYPKHKEDRELVPVDRVPDTFKAALIVTEDRDFFRHYGVKPTAIARAFWVNLREGRVVQGGSTITQQLVKNFYLTNERSLWRKANEAIMALLLEWHYEKEDILETYLNEVYLGQDGPRGVHGVALASRFYFNKSVEQLSLHEQALLVAMVKGPSYYDPRRHPERAKKRRDLVLDQMQALGVVDKQATASAKKRSLSITNKPPRGNAKFPAFMDVVKDQLRRDYADEAIHSEGLKIYSTLQVHVQVAAEKAVQRQMSRFGNNSLQTAGVITSTNTGEVLAMVGGREPKEGGFNRALNAKRQIGSLVKPVVYLKALEEGRTLISPVNDGPIELTDEKGELWTPKNYDGEFHGQVALIDALTHSYNASAVQLGLDLGIANVADRVQTLATDSRVSSYPSMLLGAVNMSPYEVAQLYQTLSAGGFKSPLRAIYKVYRADGMELQRYPLAIEQLIAPEHAYLTSVAMQWVVKEGTAKSVSYYLPESVGAAGKTGTTNDTRDSWFAGFTGDKLGVFWVGNDDNQPTRLTGASGALKLWGETFKQLPNEPLRLEKPDNVKFMWVDPNAFAKSAEFCEGAAYVPFVVGTEPQSEAKCIQGGVNKLRLWFYEVFR